MFLYIVNSGAGYFVRFDGDSSLMDSDPLCATRMSKEQAGKVAKRLGELGFDRVVVKLRIGIHGGKARERLSTKPTGRRWGRYGDR